MLGKIKRIYASPIFFVLLSIIFFFVAILPILIGIYKTPKGYLYPYLDHAQEGFQYHYLAVMNYAKKGPEWTAKQPYVYQPHRSSVTQSLYVFLGKMAKGIHIDIFVFFVITKLFGGALLLLSVYIFFHALLPSSLAKVASILYLISEPFPYLNAGQLVFPSLADGYWQGDIMIKVAERPPHYILSQGFLFLALFCGVTYANKKKANIRYLLFMLSFCVISGFINPTPVFMVAVSIGLALVISFVLRLFGSQITNRKTLITYSSFLIASSIPLSILYGDIHQGWPWNIWITAEIAINAFETQMGQKILLQLGPLLLLLPIILYRFAKKGMKSFLEIFLVVWCFSGLIIMPFVNVLHLSIVRLIEGTPIIPYIALLLISIDYVYAHMFKNTKKSYIIAAFSFFGIFYVFYFICISSILFYQRIEQVISNTSQIYLAPKTIEALHFLGKIARFDSVVLAHNIESKHIPAFAPVRTVLGGPIVYLHNEAFVEEEYRASLVLSSAASVEEAQEYLKSRNVKYVYVRIFTFLMKDLYPSLLTKIFDNEEYVIYEVKPTI